MKNSITGQELPNSEVALNSLASLRNILFSEITKIRNGEADLNDSLAISKLSHQVIDSYKTEIVAVQVANSLKDQNSDYKNSLLALDK